MSRKPIPSLPNGAVTPVPDLDARILREEDGVIVVNKPPDLPSTGRSLDDSDCLQFWLMQRERRMVWAVHQLDADTSGVNVFVRRKPLVPEWQQRMRFPNGQKTYLAIVHGAPEWDRRRAAGPIGFVRRGDWNGNAIVPDGKKAATRFTTLARSADGQFALLSATLETGRTHQIRVHLQGEGLSLVGEEWYRDTPSTAHPRQALHAAKIWFRDGTAPPMMAPLSPDLMALATRLGLVDAVRAWYDPAANAGADTAANAGADAAANAGATPLPDRAKTGPPLLTEPTDEQ